MKKSFARSILSISPYLVIILLSLIPPIYTWGRLPIWGDTIIPFNSLGLKNYLYQWNALRGGMYLSLNYLPYLIFYKLTELFTHNVYLVSAILLFLLKATSGLGILKLSRLLYYTDRFELYSFPVIFYLLSPAQLNTSYYPYVYALAPWFIFFVFRCILRGRLTVLDVISLSVILFFSSINLPNPKYIFHLFIITLVTALASAFLKIIRLDFFVKNIGKFAILILMSAYLIFPQITFVSYYNAQNYKIHVRTGYKDTGVGIDFGESTLGRMWKLRKDSINLNSGPRGTYTSSRLLNFLSYLFPLVIISVFIRRLENKTAHKHFQTVLLALTVAYLFFAAGPNPPFGLLYDYFIITFPILAFLRTTAGAVFFLSVFYALLLFSFIVNQQTTRRQNLSFAMLVLTSILVGYPILNGEFYKNVRVVSPNTDTSKHGFIIPHDYFRVKDMLDSFRYDSKVLYPNSELSYISTNWGFFGVAIYDFLYLSDNLGCEGLSNPYHRNIGLIFNDKSIIHPLKCPIDVSETDVLVKTNLLTVSQVPVEIITPHIYSTTDTINTPIIEFKKINPTKYRVIVHGATDKFSLNFSENFHTGWKIYHGNSPATKPDRRSLSVYKMLENNDRFQADTDEIGIYINNGWLTTLGDLSMKEQNHYNWRDTGRSLTSTELYQVEFVSKKFKNSIQNNNLPNGTIWETWREELSKINQSHKVYDSFANNWEINPGQICLTGSICRRNQDGSYDIELVIYFEPQRVYDICLIVSGSTLLICLIYLILTKHKKNNDR